MFSNKERERERQKGREKGDDYEIHSTSHSFRSLPFESGIEKIHSD